MFNPSDSVVLRENNSKIAVSYVMADASLRLQRRLVSKWTSSPTKMLEVKRQVVFDVCKATVGCVDSKRSVS